jgi:16S rRNA (uracil1498-N3)-methyltransferase
VLLIGPEGDWTLDELELLVQTGAVPVGLGRLRLRTETAAISLLAAVSNFG